MDSHDTLDQATCSVDMQFPTGEVDRAVRQLLSVKGKVQTKRGCRACGVGRDADDAGLVHYHGELESAEAFHRHVRSEEFRRISSRWTCAARSRRSWSGICPGTPGWRFCESCGKRAWYESTDHNEKGGES